MTAIRFGVIGVGDMGSIHAQHLASRVPGAHLEAIADVNEEKALSTGKRLGVAKLYFDSTALLADRDVDAVVIATRRGVHSALIVEAAAAGKHIFTEKPLAASVEECDAAIAAVTKAGVKLQVGFHRRSDPHFARVKDVIAAGEIGRPLMMHMIARDPNPAAGNSARTPEDLFLETTSHDLDMARHLTGSEVAEVYALGVRGADGRSLEGALLSVTMANGVVATIENHLYSAYGYDQRVEVFGSAGAVAIANQTPDNATVSDASGLHKALPLHFFAQRYGEAYTAELAAFVRCIVDGTEPSVTGADGRASLVAALAAVDSLATGKPVRVR